MPNLRKVPLKGGQDFTRFSDERLEAYLDLVQGLIYAYTAFSDEREVLFRIWKALSDHQIDRDIKAVSDNPITSSVGVKSKPLKAFVTKPRKLFIRQ